MHETQEIQSKSPPVRFIIAEPTVLAVIAVNALAVFLSAFPEFPTSLRSFFRWIDYGCVWYFVVEAALKIRTYGFRGYWSLLWNRFDMMIVLASMPILMTTPALETGLGPFAIAPLFRVGRFLRFLRLVRFVPDAPRLWRGTIRAIRASVGVFIVLLVLNLVLAMGANILFAERAPKYFGNPLTSSYTLFKVFTVEGWHEIPDEIVGGEDVESPLAQIEASIGRPLDEADVSPETWEVLQSSRRNASPVLSNAEKLVVRGYFIVSVLIGGILGLSLANAIFVDEMMMDNNQELEARVSAMQDQITELKTELLEAIRK